MKKAIRQGVYGFIETFFHVVFWIQLKKNRTRTFYFFDIDNTLADTWPSYLVRYPNENKRLMSLSVFISMRRLIMQLSEIEKNKIIFITARSYASYLTTFNWLKSLGLPLSLFDLIVVEKASDKFELIRRYKLENRSCVMIDDLSYNHEKGEIKFYTEEIAKIKSMKLKYHGYAAIRRFNGFTEPENF